MQRDRDEMTHYEGIDCCLKDWLCPCTPYRNRGEICCK